MGNLFTTIKNKFDPPKKQRILMLGLDGVGKTTILYKLKLGEVISNIPTIGFNVETVTYKNIELKCWDMGGRDRIRPLWKHYMQDTTALIFVVDSNDTERMSYEYHGSACHELHHFLQEPQLKDVPVLIMRINRIYPMHSQ